MDFKALESAFKQWSVLDFKVRPEKRASMERISGQLKKQLIIGFVWVAAISLFYIALAIWAQVTLVWVFSATMLVFNSIIARPMLEIYKKLNTFFESQSVVIYIKELLGMYDEWYRSQKRLLTFSLPIATIFGGVLGAYSKDPSMLTKEFILGPFGLILLLVSIPLSVLGYWGFKWLYKHSYGNKVAQLRQFYQTLTSDESS